MISYKEIFKEILKRKKLFFTAQLLALLAVLASVPTPLLMPLLVDEVLLGKEGKLIAFINSLFGEGSPLFYTLVVLVITLLLRTLYTLFQILQAKIFHTLSKEITFWIRQRVLNHLQKVALEEYEIVGRGEIASRLVSDIATIDTFLSGSISKLLVSVLTLVGVVIVLLLIHWKLALFILFLNPAVIIFSTKLARKVARLKREENRAIELFQSALIETLELIEQIKAVNKEKLFFRNLLSKSKELKEKAIAFSIQSEAKLRVSFLLFLAGFELFRAAGIITVAYSDLSIGLMMAIFGYLWFMMTPVQDILNIQYAKKNADIAIERINALLKLKPEPHFPHLKNPFKEKFVTIKVKNLHFAYDKVEVLKGINLTIPSKKITAIVGASGSGKTTLARLLVGFYTPTQGDIFYNQANMKEIGLDVIRENVGLVLQNPLLFKESLLFNLTLGKEIPQKRIEEVIEMVQLKEFVKKRGLKKKLEAVSGGERQRIAIARVILQEPKVVLLDESTSALDLETEKLLFCNIKPFLKARTTILIAHRPSTIQEADQLLFLDNGKVIKEIDFKEFQEKSLCILEERGNYV